MNKYIITLIIIVMIGSVTAYTSNRLTMKYITDNYYEECYEYEQVPFVDNISYRDYGDGRCNGFMGLNNIIMVNYSYTINWNVNCTVVTKYLFFNSTTNGQCIKYHLVREVGRS